MTCPELWNKIPCFVLYRQQGGGIGAMQPHFTSNKQNETDKVQVMNINLCMYTIKLYCTTNMQQKKEL